MVQRVDLDVDQRHWQSDTFAAVTDQCRKYRNQNHIERIEPIQITSNPNKRKPSPPFGKLCPGRPEEQTCEHTPHVNINGKDDMDDLPASRDKSELKSSRS